MKIFLKLIIIYATSKILTQLDTFSDQLPTSFMLSTQPIIMAFYFIYLILFFQGEEYTRLYKPTCYTFLAYITGFFYTHTLLYLQLVSILIIEKLESLLPLQTEKYSEGKLQHPCVVNLYSVLTEHDIRKFMT